MVEIWKDIKGYEGYYQVSDMGNIKSLDRNVTYSNGVIVFTKGKLLNGFIKNNGYKSIDLNMNGKKNKFHIHRLVAQAFIPNPENKPQINHKDENRSNNCVDNLEWCTCKENLNYGNHNKKLSISQKNRSDISKVVCQYDLFGNLLGTYPSASEAERCLGVCASTIHKCCKHKVCYKTCGGFKWEYYN